MHDYSPFYSPFAPALLGALIPVILIVAVWTVVLKGFALWHAARGNQLWWFIALLIVNTLGILEIMYLIWFRPRSSDTHHSHTPAHHSSAQA
jgi:methionyl-tRNA synthetase